MNTFLLLKTLHIVSSVLLVGTGLGTAFFMFFTNRSGNLAAQAVVSRLVVRADLWFTTPAVIVQPVTGIAMAHLAGWPLNTPWIGWSLALYALTGALWLPVVWLQLQMARMAAHTAGSGGELPERYWRFARWWESLGYPAFVAMLAVFALMVMKPDLPVPWGG
ncbi:DUF2269 family protein [Hydrogenophaga sp. A37]|uniref:DUF2269 family protein n=1 Tax=Hydrogenophaga sp. A37 TaxID=1945864 RepID=UPI0009868C8C|nr:DUF2269 domain-containing protein [Hydrogenophaga sp. A37]OOG86717.1 hypothetical protein B0E41_05130 [Hydrogenophaga sp. A37]